jgi:hypothetical protein
MIRSFGSLSTVITGFRASRPSLGKVWLLIGGCYRFMVLTIFSLTILRFRLFSLKSVFQDWNA